MFATYWDEAWHTDIGRDTFWTAPHLLLYGAVAVAGLAVALWGVKALASGASLRTVLRYGPLVLAGVSGLAVLAAAPIDAAWHTSFGRDSVAWSPPHMLVLLASTAMLMAMLAGLSRRDVTLRAAVAALLMGNAVAVVFEYEAGVPQFAEALYLPVLIPAGLFVALLVRGEVHLRAPVSVVVVGYAMLRLLVGLGLLLLGRSTPDLPIAVLGFAAMDLPFKSLWRRLAAGAAATAALAWAASATGLASPDRGAVSAVAFVVIAISLVAFLATARNPRAIGAAAVVVGVAAMGLGSAKPAEAHDPGQGKSVVDAVMTANVDGHGTIQLTVEPGGHCGELAPVRVVARRAGETITGALRQTGACTFTGSISVPVQGRWFVYAELEQNGSAIEGWLPVDTDLPQTLPQTRTLYQPPAGESDVTVAQAISGGLIYAAGLGLLVMGGVVTIRERRKALTLA
jgi:hypothetical protein